MDLEIKKVCTPKKNIPSSPLRNAKYLAAFKPMEILSKTGKGIPCVWDIFPIRFEKKYIRIDANMVPDKTTIKFRSYKIYNEAINEKPIRLCILTAQK